MNNGWLTTDNAGESSGIVELTGALGLMMTVGGKAPCLEGVEAPLDDSEDGPAPKDAPPWADAAPDPWL